MAPAGLERRLTLPPPKIMGALIRCQRLRKTFVAQSTPLAAAKKNGVARKMLRPNKPLALLDHRQFSAVRTIGGTMAVVATAATMFA
jgi:hypothetical protein